MNPRDDDKILLKENDNYMYQVQGQLLMSNLQKCYFIVPTQCDLKYVPIVLLKKTILNTGTVK
jgi:hypothetical protein